MQASAHRSLLAHAQHTWTQSPTAAHPGRWNKAQRTPALSAVPYALAGEGPDTWAQLGKGHRAQVTPRRSGITGVDGPFLPLCLK